MRLDLQTVLSILGLLGVGTTIGALVQHWLQRATEVRQKEHELKRARYGALSILMFTRLDTGSELKRLAEYRPNIRTLNDLDRELELELLNSVLFASDRVVRALAVFLKQPDKSNYAATLSAMRRDLWGRRTGISPAELASATTHEPVKEWLDRESKAPAEQTFLQ